MLSNADMIDYLVDSGFAIELKRMLTAENDYADVEALEKLDRHSNRLRGMTVKHLEFAAEFGNVSGPIEKGKHVLSPFPEFFSLEISWLPRDGWRAIGQALRKIKEVVDAAELSAGSAL